MTNAEITRAIAYRGLSPVYRVFGGWWAVTHYGIESLTDSRSFPFDQLDYEDLRTRRRYRCLDFTAALEYAEAKFTEPEARRLFRLARWNKDRPAEDWP